MQTGETETVIANIVHQTLSGKSLILKGEVTGMGTGGNAH
jgi:hypothetical protein